MLEIRQEQQVLVFSGELDRNTVVQFWPFKPLQSMQGNAVFDLAALKHVDTAGLAWLIQVLSQAKAKSLQVTLRGMPAQLHSLAAVSDVLSLLPTES
ncbi:STAS domain-containing protein [Rheinheimera sp.]|jgi:phospholipid transport system transporter-binding protein|uniref:STAS domain-containing protein n=1 Tax=Rheinheimera sp. TaxID=1869214 RepID=UPI003D2E86E5